MIFQYLKWKKKKVNSLLTIGKKIYASQSVFQNRAECSSYIECLRSGEFRSWWTFRSGYGWCHHLVKVGYSEVSWLIESQKQVYLNKSLPDRLTFRSKELTLVDLEKYALNPMLVCADLYMNIYISDVYFMSMSKNLMMFMIKCLAEFKPLGVSLTD